MNSKILDKARQELEINALVLEEQAGMVRLFAAQLENVRSYDDMIALEQRTGAFDYQHYPPVISRIFSDLEDTRNQEVM